MTPPLAPVADLRVHLDAEMPPRLTAAEDMSLRSDSISSLAALLLDWRVDCERHLRALTNLQRWLERVRCGAASEGECDLLLQEMGRLLREAPPNHDDWTHRAETYLNRIRG